MSDHLDHFDHASLQAASVAVWEAVKATVNEPLQCAVSDRSGWVAFSRTHARILTAVSPFDGVACPGGASDV